jgi:hypothetical protein
VGETDSPDFPGIGPGSADGIFDRGEGFVAKLDANLSASAPTIASITQQVGTLELNAGVKNSLIAKLRAAQESMTRSDATAAGNQLNAFINQVRALERSGRLDQLTANSLVGAVEEIIRTL